MKTVLLSVLVIVSTLGGGIVAAGGSVVETDNNTDRIQSLETNNGSENLPFGSHELGPAQKGNSKSATSQIPNNSKNFNSHDSGNDTEPPAPPNRTPVSSPSLAEVEESPRAYTVIVKNNASNRSSELAKFGEVGTVAQSRAELNMTRNNVSTVQGLDWVEKVQKQRVGVKTGTDSFNISSLGVDTVHQKGINGENIKIGIIGGGPSVSDTPYQDQIVSVRNFKSNSPINAEPKHDTAAVEQLAEVAPQAELYITGVKSRVDFAAAMNHLVENEVDVILTEIVYYGTPGDGTGYTAQQVDQATSAGVTVVTPAGNGRMSHYEAQFDDLDQDGLHNFQDGDELNDLGGSEASVPANTNLRFFLTWSDFNSESVSDYDFYIYNERTREYVASSEASQIAGAAPFEVIDYTTEDCAPLSLVVYHYSGDTADTIEIHGPNWGYYNQYHVPEGSIVPPATSESAVSVAAYNTQKQAIASYSAEGPVKMRPGITVAGYSHLPASPYDGVYTGTSGAAPYVAGVAALVEDSTPEDQSPQEVAERIETTAVEIDAPDTISGAGIINASGAIQNADNDASENGPPAERQLSSAEIAPGGEITVTVQTEAQGDTVAIAEEFSPVVAEASVESVTVNGNSVIPFANAADSTGATVAVNELDSGDSVAIEYSINISEDIEIGTNYSITGSVSSTGGETPIESDEFTVKEVSPLDGAAGEYDADNDGDITASELGDAVTDFGQGELTASELGEVVTAFGQS